MKNRWLAFVLPLLLAGIAAAHADGGTEELKRLLHTGPDSSIQGSVQDAVEAGDEDTIRITPDTVKIVKLEADAASVIVANPDHAAVVLDSPRLLVVMPRQPGVTSFTVLDSSGETLLTRTVIVAGTVKPHYVRVRRACGSDQGCVPYAYFYCPDGCYEVKPVGSAQGGEATPPPIASSGASSSSLNMDAQEQQTPGVPTEKGGGPVVPTPMSVPAGPGLP
jgi:hypothetical protein